MQVLKSIVALLICAALQAQPPAPPRDRAKKTDPSAWAGQGVKGKIDFYVSQMDGQRHPYAIVVIGESAGPKPLVIEVNPGAEEAKAGEKEILKAEQYGWYAKKNGLEAIVLRPTGRGPGSVYQNYGEVDVLEAMDDVLKKYPVDRDRIFVTGSSMGGAATWYLTSHYPDLFAAGSPDYGYCDYRLWEKPGGSTFPMQPWEEPSWQARSAAFLLGNLEHTPLWIAHGEWDRSVGGGVPVEHSRQMYASLKEKGFNVRYTEMPKTGHTAPTDLLEKKVVWMLQQKKTRNPSHVSLTTWWLRHNRSYWLTVDQIEHYGLRSFVDANYAADQVVVRTENVRAFSIGPIAGAKSGIVRIDGAAYKDMDLTQKCSFRRTGSHRWMPGAVDVTAEKHHGSSGPISDIFFDNVILVAGTVGDDAGTHFNWDMLTNSRTLFKDENGGLHRGGIRGSNSVDLAFAKDTELTEDQIRNNNLLLFGNSSNNAILKRYHGKLPLAFGEKSIRLGDRTYSGEKVSVFAVFPHPDNPGRYIAVHGGVTPDALAWGSHFSLQLLPDYVVYDRGKMLDWGFWDNAWKHPANPVKP